MDLTSTMSSLNNLSTHDQENSNVQARSLDSVAEDIDVEDMSTQAQRTTDIAIPLQAILRSSTTLSLEERTIEHSSQQGPREQDSHSETPQSANLLTSSNQIISPPPHREDFYQHKWFRYLVGFICYLALILSVFILLGAYGNVYFSQSTNPIALLQNIFTWITLYAPFSAILYTSCFLLPRAVAHWRWATLAAQWCETKWPRPRTQLQTSLIKNRELFSLSIPAGLSFVLLYVPNSAVWEGILPWGHYLTLHAFAFFVVVGGPWAIVVHRKLGKQSA
jgi:hypothetical protein